MTAISIHTPTKGATCLNIYKPRKDVNFNPHSHEGSDCRSRTRPTMITVFQSTLPRRERHGSCLVLELKIIFQSTLPRRERHWCRITVNDQNTFQSTLPRRERLLTTFSLTTCLHFNPHSHEGSDWLEKWRHLYIKYISIHTPTKGATKGSCLLSMLGKEISIHTPTKGATAILTNNFLIFCSISLINFILYLQIIQILFIFRYKFIFYFIF